MPREMTGFPSFEPIPLSLLDHTIISLYFSNLYSFASSDKQRALERLEYGIEQLFGSLPFLAGEVVECQNSDTKQGQKRIDPSPDLLVETPALQIKYHTFDSIDLTRNPINPTLIQKYAPLPPVLPPPHRHPVLRFQANVMAQGIVLGVSYHHCVFDAFGVGVVMECLAQLCKGNDVCWPEILEQDKEFREALATLAEPQRGTLPDQGHLVMESTITAEQWSGLEAEARTHLCTRRVIISDEKIRMLRSQCQNSPSLSRHDVLTAALGVSFQLAQSRARAAEKVDQSPSLRLAVNLRKRWPGPVPQSYMGNMVVGIGAPIFPQKSIDGVGVDRYCHDDLVHQVAQIGSRIRSSLNEIDDDYIKMLMSSLRKQEDYRKISVPAAEYSITSWRDIPVYSLDFGVELGRVADFEAEFGLFGGVAFILPAKRLDGSIRPPDVEPDWEVQLTLKKEDMEALNDTPFFLNLLI